MTAPRASVTVGGYPVPFQVRDRHLTPDEAAELRAMLATPVNLEDLLRDIPAIRTTATAGVTIHNNRTFASHYVCPDLLTLDDIGAADNIRGRVVRLFFHLMRAWPP